MPARTLLGGMMTLALLPALAWAEGSDSLDAIDRMLPETIVYVDILDAGTETILYTGQRPADVYTPAGDLLRTVVDGDEIVPVAGAGAYRFEFDLASDFWDLEVPGALGGRVWSDDWRFDAGSFRAEDALNRSFYALVPGGLGDLDTSNSVVELRAEGLAGYVFRVSGTSTGLPGANGRSVPDRLQRYGKEHPIYLSPPERALNNPETPVLDGLVTDVGLGDCDVLVPDINEFVMVFDSNVRGTWHLVCDLDGDGVFNLVDDGDVHIIGDLVEGENVVSWDGYGNDDEHVTPGTYDCRLTVTVGELHYVGDDIETFYPGLRMFEVTSNDMRSGLSMFWNDEAVQANDIDMASGVPGPVSSGPDGVSSGNYADPTDPLVNARGWGRFREGSKGDMAWMDTYTWLRDGVSDVVSLQIGSAEVDTDGDGLFDLEETCESLTDPENPDTDGDGLDDRLEYRKAPTDPLDPDTDDDCILDGYEYETNGRGRVTDTDGDGIVDPLDPDDDGDGIASSIEYNQTNQEDCAPAGPPPDYDGDQRPNHRDLDADGDLYSDAREGIGDRDADGNMDFLDADTVGFGLMDVDAGYFAGGCSSVPAGSGLAAMLMSLVFVRRRRE